jgi:prophage regulatory protein
MNRNVELVMNKFSNPKSVMAAMHVSGTETRCQANSQKGNAKLPRVGSSADDDDPLLRLPEVLKRVPVSRSHWWAGVASGRFPAPVRLSVRCVAWRASSIRALIASL